MNGKKNWRISPTRDSCRVSSSFVVHLAGAWNGLVFLRLRRRQSHQQFYQFMNLMFFLTEGTISCFLCECEEEEIIIISRNGHIRRRIQSKVLGHIRHLEAENVKTQLCNSLPAEQKAAPCILRTATLALELHLTEPHFVLLDLLACQPMNSLFRDNIAVYFPPRVSVRACSRPLTAA